MAQIRDTKKIVYVAKTGESSPPELYSVLEDVTRQEFASRDGSDCLCLFDDGSFTYISFVEARLRNLDCDLIVCDVTNEDPAIVATLMVALSREIPVVGLLDVNVASILDPQGLTILPFDRTSLDRPFRERLARVVSAALTDPRTHVPTNTYEQSLRYKVVISYSHRDEAVLERVMVHLRPLEVMGLVEAWSDKRLRVGGTWATQIQVALSRARLAIILVSADYLASDFIVKHELPQLLREGRSGAIRVVPLVLSPCRFARDPELGLLQSVNDPSKPLSLLTASEQEAVLDKLALLVEESVKDVTERRLAEKRTRRRHG